MTSIEMVLDRLPDSRAGGAGWSARCPAHEDGRASLSIAEATDGKVLLYCHAGCEFAAIVRALGFDGTDLFPPKDRSGKRIVAEYPYVDETGTELFQAIRFEPKDFRQRHRGPDGRWVWHLKDVRRVLYRLPEVIRAAKDGTTIFIVEGEKDVEALRSLGLVATCNPMGAGRGKWRPEFSEIFTGCKVVVLADADAPGRAHAAAIMEALKGTAASARRVEVPEGKDASDWIARGATREHFEKLGMANQEEGARGGAHDGAVATPLGAVAPVEPAAGGGGEGAARLLIRIGEENSILFHDERETPHAAIGSAEARRIVSVRSETFTTFLSGLFYRRTGRAANSEALTGAKRVLSHKAVFDGPKVPLFNRFAFHDGAVWVDLANERQEAVRVTADGWTVEKPPILFRRFKRQAALPTPATNGNMEKVSDFLNLREKDDEVLSHVWPVTALLGHLPRPILDMHGPQGSAKTTTAKIFRRLTDPSVAPTSYLSQRDDELALCLESNAVPLFDNVTRISARQGEVLCAAVTGGGFSKRQLFTDSEEILYDYRRAIILTGINVATVAPDLLDRFLLLQLDRIDRAARRSEAALWQAFETAAPIIFAGMLDALSSAMKVYPIIAGKIGTLERMADFTLWGASTAEALGFGAEAFLSAYAKNVSAQTEEVLEADPVARAVREHVARRGGWTGTATELLKIFREQYGDETKSDGWPKRADGLSRRLRVLQTTLADVGISIVWQKRTGESRTLTISSQAIESSPRSASSPSLASPERRGNGADDANDTNDAKKGDFSTTEAGAAAVAGELTPSPRRRVSL